MDSGSDRDWFWRQEVAPGLYLIRERFFESGNRANIWLLQGSHRDLVVDAGLGLRSLPAYLRESGLSAGPRPLLAVATHVHFDHSGGLHHFERVAVHRAEAGALSRGDNFEAVTWLSDGELSRRPEPGWRAGAYRVRAVQPTQVLEAGDIISLGDRQLAVLHMPGHSRGSICLHDRQHGLLFSGDVAYDGALIDWLPYSSISDYSQSCSELMGLVDSGLVRTVLPGHFNTFGAERLRSLAAQYIANAGLCHRVSTSAMRCMANLVLRGKNFSRSGVDQ